MKAQPPCLLLPSQFYPYCDRGILCNFDLEDTYLLVQGQGDTRPARHAIWPGPSRGEARAERGGAGAAQRGAAADAHAERQADAERPGQVQHQQVPQPAAGAAGGDAERAEGNKDLEKAKASQPRRARRHLLRGDAPSSRPAPHHLLRLGARAAADGQVCGDARAHRLEQPRASERLCGSEPSASERRMTLDRPKVSTADCQSI